MHAGRRLDTGDRLPDLHFDTVGGGSVSLPDDLTTDHGLLVVVRAGW